MAFLSIGDSVTSKAVQPATFTATQDAKDSGRVAVCVTLDSFPTAATAETLMTVTRSAGGATVSTPTSMTITAGKKFRLQSWAYTVENGGSVPVLARVKVRIRVNTAGATTAAGSSPIQHLVTLAVAATAKATTSLSGDFGDGAEFNGDGTATWGVTVESPEFVTTTQIPVVHLSITGYEY